MFKLYLYIRTRQCCLFVVLFFVPGLCAIFVTVVVGARSLLEHGTSRL
jgi:hypothetical protein